MDNMIKELEARVIERAKFWDGYINMLIRLRDAATTTNKFSHNEKLLRVGLQQAIDAAILLQREELAECFLLSGIGGKQAEEYARERAKAILGEKQLEFANSMGWVPTYWAKCT